MTLDRGDSAALAHTNDLHPFTEASPTSDFSGDPWVGVFPGLGSVSVTSDGEVAVSAECRSDEDPESLAQRERALRWGWADPLSWWRRGYQLMDAISMGDPEGHGSIVISGDYDDSGRLAVGLMAEGWSLIADRPSPYRWEGEDLFAFPREAPFLLVRGRAIKANLAHQSIRADSDTVEVDVPRTEEPRRVEAIVRVSTRRNFESTVEVLSGHKAFREASGLLLSRPRRSPIPDIQGSGADADESTRDLAQNLRLVKIPMLRVRRTPGDYTSVQDLLEWREGREPS